jgi:hypothetical protein
MNRKRYGKERHWNYWDFERCPSSGILKNTKNTTVQKLDVFPSSGVDVSRSSF